MGKRNFLCDKSKVVLLLETIGAQTNQAIPDGLTTYIHERLSL